MAYFRLLFASRQSKSKRESERESDRKNDWEKRTASDG